MRTIVAAVDMSEMAGAVADAAASLAEGTGAAVWLIHVAAPEPPFVGYDVGPQSVRQQVANQIRSEHRRLQEMEKALRDRGVAATSLLVQGPTVDKVLEECARLKADCLVVGSHGHGPLYHLVLGSVSADILKRAACPVLVVPSSRP